MSVKCFHALSIQLWLAPPLHCFQIFKRFCFSCIWSLFLFCCLVLCFERGSNINQLKRPHYTLRIISCHTSALQVLRSLGPSWFWCSWQTDGKWHHNFPRCIFNFTIPPKGSSATFWNLNVGLILITDYWLNPSVSLLTKENYLHDEYLQW